MIKRSIDNNLIITKCSGLITVKDIISSLYELNEIIGTNPTLYEFVVDEKGSNAICSFQEMVTVSNIARKIYYKCLKGRIAFVGKQPVFFGKFKQFSSMARNDKISISVFQDDKIALRWLESMSQPLFPENPAKIEIHQDSDIEYWTNKLNVARDELIETVKRVGEETKLVKKSIYLKRKQIDWY